MIQLKDLTLGYEQRILLEKVSTHITGGQLVALLGRNGTGKARFSVPSWGWKHLKRRNHPAWEKHCFTETGEISPKD